MYLLCVFFCLWFVCMHVRAEPETECYNSRGTGYRGVAGTTVSGARCLPWDSDLLYDELHVGTVVASPLRGLGEHAYCRCVCVCADLHCSLHHDKFKATFSYTK